MLKWHLAPAKMALVTLSLCYEFMCRFYANALYESDIFSHKLLCIFIFYFKFYSIQLPNEFCHHKWPDIHLSICYSYIMLQKTKQETRDIEFYFKQYAQCAMRMSCCACNAREWIVPLPLFSNKIYWTTVLSVIYLLQYCKAFSIFKQKDSFVAKSDILGQPKAKQNHFRWRMLRH